MEKWKSNRKNLFILFGTSEYIPKLSDVQFCRKIQQKKWGVKQETCEYIYLYFELMCYVCEYSQNSVNIFTTQWCCKIIGDE